jgi:hypothetical protein
MPLGPGFECDFEVGFTFGFRARRAAAPRAEGRAAFFPVRARLPAGLVLACFALACLACPDFAWRGAAGFGFGACFFGAARFREGFLAAVMSMALRE